jgi:hypothetical protein
MEKTWIYGDPPRHFVCLTETQGLIDCRFIEGEKKEGEEKKSAWKLGKGSLPKSAIPIDREMIPVMLQDFFSELEPRRNVSWPVELSWTPPLPPRQAASKKPKKRKNKRPKPKSLRFFPNPATVS